MRTATTPLLETPKVSPEWEMLLCCARTQLGDGHRERIHFLAQSDLDWGFLFRLAHGHVVYPLVYRNLCAVCDGDMPDAVRSAFRECVHAAAAYNTFMAVEADSIMVALDAGGISAMLLKGLVLGATAYRDIRLRPCTDIDILVSRAGFDRAERALVGCGYALQVEPGRFRDARLAMRTAFESEFRFGSESSVYVLDLHTALGPRRFFHTVPVESLWHRRASVVISGRQYATLSAPDTLHHLCYHGAKHRWVGLKFFVDVAAFLEGHPSLDWDAVMQRSDEMRDRRMLLFGLDLVSTLLGAHLPGEVTRLVRRDPWVERNTARTITYLLHRSSDDEGDWSRMVFHTGINESLRGKTRYVANAIILNSRCRRLLRV